MRFFLGAHKYATIPGLRGEMGCVSLSVDRRVSMAKFWNRIILIDISRRSIGQFRLWIMPLEIETGRYASILGDVFVSYVTLGDVKMKDISCLHVLYIMTCKHEIYILELVFKNEIH